MMMRKSISIFFATLLCLVSLQLHAQHFDSNDGPPDYDIDVSNIPDAQPKHEARSVLGNPPSYTVYGHQYAVMKSARDYRATGIASWYGMKFQRKRTSSGEPYDLYGMTAAHRNLPIPCYLRVTNLVNGRSVIVRVNDRGPFNDTRIIDLSYAAAKKLGILQKGTGLVELEGITPNEDLGDAPAPLSHPHIFLQVGAFTQRFNAVRHAKKIAKFTQHTVRLVLDTVNDHDIYRVQIGPLASVAVSDELHYRIREKGMGDALPVIQ